MGCCPIDPMNKKKAKVPQRARFKTPSLNYARAFAQYTHNVLMNQSPSRAKG